MTLTWGDVLCAAIDACSAVGTDATITDDDLARMVRNIIAIRGDARSTYSARRTGQGGWDD